MQAIFQPVRKARVAGNGKEDYEEQHENDKPLYPVQVEFPYHAMLPQLLKRLQRQLPLMESQSSR